MVVLRTLILVAVAAGLVSLLFHRLTGRWLWQRQFRLVGRWLVVLGLALAVGSLLERLIVAYR